MTLNELCDRIRKSPRSIRTDSRKVEVGDIFVALPPAAREGSGAPDLRSDYIRSAKAQGAGVIVADPRFAAGSDNGTEGASPEFIPVADARSALGQLAAARWGTEHLNFPVIAVTGTNGKTTCAYLLEHAWRSSGRKAGVLGTVS